MTFFLRIFYFRCCCLCFFPYSLEMHRNMTLTLDLNTCSSGSLASGASLSEISLPLSSGNNSVAMPSQAYAHSINLQSIELKAANDSACNVGSVPSLALNPQSSLPVLNPQNPLSSFAFNLVKSPVLPATSLSTAASNINLPQATPIQFNPLNLDPQQPSPFTIPGDRLAKPIPIISGFIGAMLVNPQRNLTTKMKGGICLASATNKFGQKYSPY